MQPAAKLIKQIRDAIASDGVGAPIETLAAEYARLAAEAAQRLESCAEMIAKGSDYQALQLAETEPVLLDLIAALSFAEAPEWTAYCAEHGLPFAPKFDAQAVQALDALYAKGITANHPLYKAYRTAVTSRDDARAIQIIRSIVRLNPDDANAKSELVRLENKLFQLQLQALRAALAARDEAPILQTLAELERLAPPAKLAELAEYNEASAIRRAVARREAEAQAVALVETLPEERANGAWRTVADRLAQLHGLQAEHGFALPPDDATRCAEWAAWVEQERHAAAETTRFQQALNALGGQAEQLDTRLLTRASLTLAEAGQLYLDFNRRWKEVEAFQRPVPEEALRRVRSSAGTLRTELDRLQRQRRLRLGLSTAAVLAVFGLAAWFALRAFRTSDYAGQLAALQGRGEVEAAEKMSVHLRGEKPALAAQPALRAKLDATDAWTREERASLGSVEAQLTALESGAGKRFDGADPLATQGQIENTAQLIDGLAASLHGAVVARLAVVRNQFDAHLSGMREQLVGEAEAEVTRLETRAGSDLGYDRPRPTLTAALGEIEPALKTLEARAKPAVAALELPAALQSRVAALRKRAALFRTELDLLRQVHESLVQATTLEAYQKALAGIEDSRLAQVAEVHDARKLLATFPKADDVMAGLLMPGDPVAWAAVKNTGTADPFIPETVLPAELGKLLALREDSYLNDIWQLTISDFSKGGGKRDAYSRGEVKKDGPRDLGGGVLTTSWTGNIYDPSLRTEVPAFAPTTFTVQRAPSGSSGNGEVFANRRSSVSDCLDRLELNRMTDADGAKYERALLGVFDGIVRNKDTSPLARGYLMQQLGALLAIRPYAWGLQYCASLRRDLARLDEICADTPLRSMDWLLERKRAQLQAPLAAFFAELQTRSYLAEARLHREAVRAALAAGLRFGGFIDATGQPQLLGEAAAAPALWAVAADGRAIVRFDSKTAATACARYSPIFHVPVDRAALTKAGGPATRLPAIPLFD